MPPAQGASSGNPCPSGLDSPESPLPPGALLEDEHLSRADQGCGEVAGLAGSEPGGSFSGGYLALQRRKTASLKPSRCSKEGVSDAEVKETLHLGTLSCD